MSPYKPPLILLACALGFGLAACGSSGSSHSSGAAASPSKGPSLNLSLDGTIAANWATFFNAQTPVARRISLLQNGQEFATVIKDMAGKGLASEATARVDGITQLSSTQAKVVYDILIAGTPALKAQSGMAVLQGGTWKVGDTSFCGLLQLEAGGSTKGLPSACQSAAG